MMLVNFKKIWQACKFCFQKLSLCNGATQAILHNSPIVSAILLYLNLIGDLSKLFKCVLI